MGAVGIAVMLQGPFRTYDRLMRREGVAVFPQCSISRDWTRDMLAAFGSGNIVVYYT
jgi:hypothetical protein